MLQQQIRNNNLLNEDKDRAGDFERVKDFKMIPSYEISIMLKDNELIKIVSFNKPYIFES